jgi:5-methylcytosine-specific restriction endonuclease McrA
MLSPESFRGSRNKCRKCEVARHGDDPVGRVASHLKWNHSYIHDDAMVLARLLLNKNTRCAICGMPNKFLKLFRPYPYGKEIGNRHLTVDHIDPKGPSTLENSRPLCFSCNAYKSHWKTDEQVFRWMRGYWDNRKIAPRYLFWLNTEPGIGGRLNRSKYTENRDKQLEGDAYGNW